MPPRGREGGAEGEGGESRRGGGGGGRSRWIRGSRRRRSRRSRRRKPPASSRYQWEWRPCPHGAGRAARRGRGGRAGEGGVGAVGAGGPVEAGVAEAEDPAVGSPQPVAVTSGSGGHAPM